ncbi:MAG: polyprenyl synthetase family protein, partial [Leifsonia sp.]|nr:polyprenyl synthetase family protein [Leifsonia sp.]
MAGSTRLVDLVQVRLDSFLAEQSAALLEISPDLDVIDQGARALLAGGKRFRALFCYWGWQAIAALGDDFDLNADASASGELDGVVAVAASLEIFHAAALVHDDIMDNSDLRRGQPSVHKRFEALHGDRGWTGDAPGYGRAAALLTGDLLLGWSDELFERGLASGDHAAAAATRAEFTRMRTEVTVGQ